MKKSKESSHVPLPLPVSGRGTPSLAVDLKKLEALAFSKVSNCREFVERYHALSAAAAARKHSDFGLVEKLYGWMFVPLSLWPLDVRGLGMQVLACVVENRPVDDEARLTCQLLPDAPPESVCAAVAAHEHAVSAGNYESVNASSHKFDSIEQELGMNAEMKADWDAIKRQFDISEFQNSKGMIRRRMVQERNFRPADWKISWPTATKAQRFQNVFDAFCHKWEMYGMEFDRPLLAKLTVNATPYGTSIMVPKYWSFDPHRDLKWKEITQLHRARNPNAQKQGAKLSRNAADRRRESERARAFWQAATESGLMGKERDDWVMGRMEWDGRTDVKKLRRMMGERAG